MSHEPAREQVWERVWGLTGGIASGKSIVARLFEEEGFLVIDADQVARGLSAPGGAAHEAILARFGTTERARLREIVFSDPKARQDLEAILHPRIREESLRRMRETRAIDPRRPVIYEAALLVETGRYREFQGLIVIDAPRETRRARLIARDGCAPELADRILSAQAADADRLRAASYVILNDGSLDELRSRVRELSERLRSR